MARPAAYYERPTRGPSPWIPATILGIILLVATTPYRMAPDVAMAYHPAARRPANYFPSALIWIPVIFFLLIQFFGGSYRPYRTDRLGMPPSYGGGVAGVYGDAGVYPGGPYDVNNIRYNGGPYADRGVMGSFMDFGGHWLLIFLGIWVFSLVGVGSAPVNTATSRWGFPWSLFAPQPQIVMPIL
ncbi:hypothetical protein M758_12G131600 [Ceratodon purpureus]|uniref:Uncharacterized protein n=1 Tax=Ceratodon purpureus TaxID=3225 RepID=A0A8T0GAN5_CERPU|nr:hypothetical protein KC19_12G128600 [Ceratodon purpureus]KAG0599152.1 hypothetical protein M758_12G131600 [Ceratodon purpureus]